MFNRLNGDRLLDQAREAVTESRDFARRGADRANAFIHARPLTAALLGMGAGLMIGIFFPRRQKPAVRRRTRALSNPRKRARD